MAVPTEKALLFSRAIGIFDIEAFIQVLPWLNIREYHIPLPCSARSLAKSNLFPLLWTHTCVRNQSSIDSNPKVTTSSLVFHSETPNVPCTNWTQASMTIQISKLAGTAQRIGFKRLQKRKSLGVMVSLYTNELKLASLTGESLNVRGGFSLRENTTSLRVFYEKIIVGNLCFWLGLN